MGRSGAAAAAAVEVESSGSASGRRADVTTGVYRPGPRRVRQTGIVSEVAPAVRSDPNPTVVVVGSINVDVVAQVERHPAPGETVLGDGGEVRCCGKGANQAVAAAYAGACVALFGAIGSARRLNIIDPAAAATARRAVGSLDAEEPSDPATTASGDPVNDDGG